MPGGDCCEEEKFGWKFAFVKSKRLDHVPIVSVIIPTYNRPEMLDKALKSILTQSWRSFEIHVVNDAGGDVSKIIADNNRNDLISYIQNERHRGRSASRNTALRMARGKYITYLDDDDVYYPNHLETLVLSLESSKYKVAYSDAHRIHQVKKNGAYIEIGRDIPYSFDFDASALLKTNYIPILSVMHERSCLEAVGLFDENLEVLEDWDLWIRLSQKYPFVHIPKVTAGFTWRTDGSSTTSSPDYRPEWHRCRQIIEAKHKEVRCRASVPSITTREVPLKNGAHQTPTGPLISIVILSLNQWDWTLACIKSIAKYTFVPYEIVVVDNGSSRDTVASLMNYARDNPAVTTIFNEKNLGFAAGNNQGLALARGDYMLLLNNDTLVTEGWLERLLRLFSEYPRCGIAGPMSNYVIGPQLAEARYSSIEEMEFFASTWCMTHRGQSFSVPIAVGFCMLIKRAVVDAVGGLDDLFGIGNFEDNDYCHRTSLAGFEIRIAKDVFIHHQGGQTFKSENFDYARLMKKNWELFKAKWGLPASLPLMPGYIPLSKKGTLRQFVPLPSLDRTHSRPTSERIWVDNSLRLGDMGSF